MSQPELIAVDFDKTLTDPDQDEWKPAFQQEPRQEMIDKVVDTYEKGIKIIIWTARQWSEAAQVKGWLTAHEVPHHGLMCGKGGADQYVDDKAIQPEEFLGDVEVMRIES
jgi:hydroxymethylpyrimidine pyrophosphatase-like HAD family hydrolase